MSANPNDTAGAAKSADFPVAKEQQEREAVFRRGRLTPVEGWLRQASRKRRK
jgi:hypothetical protein